MFYREVIHGKFYERNPRKGTLQPHWLRHRFPIKNGLSFRETLLEDMRSQNYWSELFKY